MTYLEDIQRILEKIRELGIEVDKFDEDYYRINNKINLYIKTKILRFTATGKKEKATDLLYRLRKLERQLATNKNYGTN